MNFKELNSKTKLSALEQLLELCDHAHIKHIHNYIEPKLQRDYISELPRELILLLLTYVRPKDLYKLAQVSHYFHQIANDPILWKNICKKSKILVGLNCVKSIEKTSGQEHDTAKSHSHAKVNTRNRNINNDNMSYVTNDECDEEEDDEDDDDIDDEDFYSLSSQSNSNNTNNNNNNNLQINFNNVANGGALEKKGNKSKNEIEDENDDEVYEPTDDEEIEDDEDEDGDDDVVDNDGEDASKNNDNVEPINNPSTSSGVNRVRSPVSPSSCSSTEQSKSNQNGQASSQLKSGKIFEFFLKMFNLHRTVSCRFTKFVLIYGPLSFLVHRNIFINNSN